VSDELRLTVEEPILQCRVQPVRYRPTSRCVLRYDVRTASGLSPYYAKVFSRSTFADASRRASRVSTAAQPTRLRVSRVLEVWPELCTTVSVAVDGRSASSMLRDASLSAQSRLDLAERLGGLLADLHVLPEVSVPVRTSSDHLRAVADLMPAVRLLDAALADRLRRLLDRLERTLPPRDHENVLIHGAFRPGQVVVDDAGLLHLLDLDGAGRGDAAQDLGTALGHLSWAEIRQPSSGVTPGDVDQALLAGYGASGLPVSRASLIWWRAAVLAQIAARRYRRLDVADWPLVPQLIDLAESLLAGRTGGEAS
jgi:aminoglycoside phosphotransferase